eukprot:gnl/MRDRNA2_/MRDRNA2_35925_c0_seq1.p1 gnl/MRDRNA2_/MRDRNA2_35925_c0~~gnl/MRDRNA2_/MRDRNA2_35925_c0_seq1.p1  ORF type:complete len:405 (+),score=79.43 gnl/MRDRNA2_/MRDRNA2_35925_c0_seq1:71-1285(+)
MEDALSPHAQRLANQQSGIQDNSDEVNGEIQVWEPDGISLIGGKREPAYQDFDKFVLEGKPRARFGGVLEGTVKSYSEKNQCGFIANDKCREAFGRDVFVQRIEFEKSQARVGALVTFQLQFDNERRPQARNMTIHPDDEDYKGPPAHNLGNVGRAPFGNQQGRSSQGMQIPVNPLPNLETIGGPSPGWRPGNSNNLRGEGRAMPYGNREAGLNGHGEGRVMQYGQYPGPSPTAGPHHIPSSPLQRPIYEDFGGTIPQPKEMVQWRSFRGELGYEMHQPPGQAQSAGVAMPMIQNGNQYQGNPLEALVEMNKPQQLFGGRLEGVIKSYSKEKGCGFVSCQQIRTLWGRDAFLQQREFDNSSAQVGDQVCFQVQLDNEGRPQVRNMQITVSAQEGSGSDARWRGP